ncbi:hypothetical protein ERO13_D07G147400v2, partial [Gossypium hirsutum]
DIFVDFYSLPSSTFTHSLPYEPYFTLTNSHLKILKRQPYLASFDSGILHLHPRTGALRWLGTRENQTTNRLGKGMSGPLLAQRVKGRCAKTVQYNNIKFQVWDLGMMITTS